MDPQLQERLDMMERKIDAVWESAEKTRKYILWTVIGTVVTFVLPLIGLAIVIPMVLNTLTDAYSGLL